MPKLTLNASKNTKHTSAGEIPVDWGWASLDTLTFKDKRISYGIVQPGDHCPEGHLLIRSQDYSKGWASVDTMMRVTELIEKPYKRSRVSSNDLLITVVGAGIGNLAIVPDYLNGANISRSVARISINGQRANSRFVYHFLQVGIRQLLQINSTGGAQPVLNLDELRRFPIPLPPLAEQRKIADILSTWEVSLDALDALITAKDRQKQALMQQLLNRSLAHRQTSHARHRLGEVCERVTRRNNSASENVLTISAQQGLVSQKDYFNRSVAGADLANYYLLNRGEFAYNRSSAKGYPYGAIKRLDCYDTGVVSTLYLCFRIKPKAEVSSNYLSQYFEAGCLNSGLRSVAKEGARAHGLLNVTADEFFDLDIFLPTLAEQQQIAAILDTADQELTLLRTQRQTLDQQKRGLMQRLLTGKIRVTPTPESDV